jgi:hypothetical protein
LRALLLVEQNHVVEKHCENVINKQSGHDISTVTVHRIQHSKGAIPNNIPKQVIVVLLPNDAQ